MSKVSTGLPKGWAIANLGELVDRLQYGFTAKSSLDLKGPRLLRITDIREGAVDWNTVPGCNISEGDLAKYRLVDGDMVFARSGSIEKTYRISNPPEAVFASYLIRGRPIEKSMGSLLEHFFKTRHYLNQIGAFGSGIAIQNVNARKLSSIRIPIPPLNEQKRIVARIEELQARSRRAREALETVPDLLEQLRQSLLAAAFRGDLTKECRKKNPDVEPASELLKRIRAERRKRWEETELEKLKAKGLTADKLNEEFSKRRKQYKEPIPVDATDLPELPANWCWASLEEISEWVTDGTHQPPPFAKDGIPFLVISNMANGKIEWNKVDKWVSPEIYEKFTGSYKPQKGDIIYSIVGSYGVAVEVVTDKRFMFQRHIGHLRPLLKFYRSKYLTYALNSPFTKSQADKVARGVAQKTVNLSDLRRFFIPLSPFGEQKEILGLLDKAFQIIEVQRKTFRSCLSNLDDIDRSILAKAFRGALAPQDPNDEPASVLLERIRAEKSSTRRLKNKEV
jgi:type I restriction enzyme S subunit